MRSTEELARHAKADSLSFGIWHFDPEALERFAALVRAQVLDEAAMIVEDMPQNAWIAYAGMGDYQVMLKKSGISHIDASAMKLVTTKAAAAAIRAARGATP